MNDTAIKNFCIWARRELIEQVAVQARRYGIREYGYDPASADVVEGVPLSSMERAQRAELIRRLGPADADGYEDAFAKLIDQAAYTWFNRLVAIRFMELNDRLPSHVRVLSADDGSFRPQVLREALDVGIEGVDQAQVSTLIAASDDEALFRYMFLAQCAELSSCMPDVFEPVGASLELLLPEGLLRQGGVVERLVADIPEQDWREGVQIVGWMYQYYNAELKDEVFASFKKGKKADREAMKPATQLFTPNWIVHYLVENSVGRIWMQSHPNSSLPEFMPYFVPDEGEAAPSSDAATSPERITVMDPACGSGHILVYVFELLARMYEEAGYTRRDIARLVLEDNLIGIEIDPRAAQLASFALTMTACNYDPRFLRRGVYPKVVALKDVLFEEEEFALVPELAERTALLDAMAHMGECGSLFMPDDADIQAIEAAERKLEGETDLFASKALEKVRQVRANCEPLARTYDVVVANPPYMGSSNMGKWLANWTKKHYPDSKRDLCTCFIERGFTLANAGGYSAMVTMQSWMFLGSFEAMRQKMLKEHSIATMAHLGTRAFDAIGGEVVATTATVFRSSASDMPASYLRLVDFENEASKEAAIREAIANPDCGWFYRRDASAFSTIPGSPIAYWASDAMIRAFSKLEPFAKKAIPRVGMQTGNNSDFLRLWWEVSLFATMFNAESQNVFSQSNARWAPYCKGGEFRKWYGNNFYLVNWANEGKRISTLREGESRAFSLLPEEYRFKQSVTWGLVSSGAPSFRYRNIGSLHDIGGMSLFPATEIVDYCLAFSNSSVSASILQMIAPTMNYQVGDVGRLPFVVKDELLPTVNEQAHKCIFISIKDYDSFETSWDFKRHPMV